MTWYNYAATKTNDQVFSENGMLPNYRATEKLMINHQIWPYFETSQYHNLGIFDIWKSYEEVHLVKNIGSKYMIHIYSQILFFWATMKISWHYSDSPFEDSVPLAEATDEHLHDMGGLTGENVRWTPWLDTTTNHFIFSWAIFFCVFFVATNILCLRRIILIPTATPVLPLPRLHIVWHYLHSDLPMNPI